MEYLSITVETPKDSTILAYGTAPAFWHERLWQWLIGVLGIILLVFLFWLGVSRPLPIGGQTLRIITRPSIANHELPDSVRRQLPSPWQQALQSDSNWPVLLGGGLGQNGWTWFAVVPRWQTMKDGLPEEKAGFARILYDQTPLPVVDHVRYLDSLGAWLRHPTQQAVGSFALEAVSTSSTLATFVYDQGILQTSLSFERPSRKFLPRLADISLDLSSLTGVIREQLIKELPVPSFALLPNLQEAHFVFHDGGMPEQVQLIHTESLTRDQTRQVLAGFGVTTKHVIQLADGTLATELTSGDGVMNQPVRIRASESLFIQDRDIRYGSSTEPLPMIPLACGDHPVVGRISARAFQKLVQGIGLTFALESITGWQLGEGPKSSMILCRE